MWTLLFADASHPQQEILLLRFKRKLVYRDSVRNHRYHIRKVHKRLALRLGHTIEIQVGSQIAKRGTGVKMTRQVQSGQYGDVAFRSPSPKTPALIMDEVECRLRSVGVLQHIQDFRLMFRVGLDEVVGLSNFTPGGEDDSAYLRSGASCDGREMTAIRNFCLYHREHLLRAATTLVRNRQQRIGNIQNPPHLLVYESAQATVPHSRSLASSGLWCRNSMKARQRSLPLIGHCQAS